MAAIERKASPLLGSIVLAACALPGVMATPALAEEAPSNGVMAFKFSHYQDSQTGYYGGNTSTLAGTAPTTATAPAPAPATGSSAARVSALAALPGMATISSASPARGSSAGSSAGGGGGSGPSNVFDRISVNTPSMYALLPISSHWAAEGSATVDQVSGASPQYYSDMRGSAHMVDRRKAGDAKISYYADRQSYSLGGARSTESDYISNALSAEARFASADQNTTWNLGLGVTRDRIDPTTHIVSNEHRRTNEVQLGVTQALSSRDLLQATLTVSRANGYMNDPYKLDDSRPRLRDADIMQLRWNHWLGGAAVKLGYRFYKDSDSIVAHTVDLALAAPMGSGVTVTPALRYYAQNAASFYANANPATYPGPVGTPTYFSADQRLSAYGAISGSLKVAVQVAPAWVVDGRAEYYCQRSNWVLPWQSGSPGINPLSAMSFQLGLSHSF